MEKYTLIFIMNSLYLFASEARLPITIQPQNHIDITRAEQSRNVLRGCANCVQDCRDFSVLCLCCPVVSTCGISEELCAQRVQPRSHAECAQECGRWALTCLCCPAAACYIAWMFGPGENRYRRKLSEGL